MTQRGTQSTSLVVMIGRCSPDSQHGRPDSHPANVGFQVQFFRYTIDDSRNHNNQGHKHKTRTREDNQLSLHCYFRSNPTQRGYSKK